MILGLKEEVFEEYGIPLLNSIDENTYHGSILCVAHKEFHNANSFGLLENHVLYDVKGVLSIDKVDKRS